MDNRNENSINNLITPAAAAEILKASERTVLRYLREGKLNGVKIMNRWYLDRNSLLDQLVKRYAVKIPGGIVRGILKTIEDAITLQSSLNQNAINNGEAPGYCIFDNLRGCQTHDENGDPVK